jgi:hypothetical protein
VMLKGVTEDDIFRIAVARHFGKFKPSSNVPFEVDIYVPVLERIIVVRNDVFELLNHQRHKRVITRLIQRMHTKAVCARQMETCAACRRRHLEGTCH